MTDFQLTPSPDEKPLPEGKRLPDFNSLAGHTIKAVVVHPRGSRAPDGSVIIITETDCWVVIYAPPGGEERSYLEVCSPITSTDDPLSDFLTPDELFQHNLISHAQHQYAKEKEAEERKLRAKKQADELRRRAAAIESGEVPFYG